MDHTLGVCFSLNPNKSTSYLLLCLSLRFFFCNEMSRTWASLGPEARQHGLCPAWIPARHDWVTKHSIESQLGKQFQTKLSEIERWWPAQYFVNSGIDGERNWRMGGKSSEKIMLRNRFHNLPGKLLNAWPVPTIFIGLILGTKEIKDSRTLTPLGNSY